jgi:CheY-like chemotaxis protein
VREVSVEALRELGYTVLPAASGEEALRILAERADVTLLFTDVVMPGMTGPALAEAARRIYPELRLLYTSGYTPEGGSETWPGESEGGMLPKPFTVAQLAAKIRSAIDG